MPSDPTTPSRSGTPDTDAAPAHRMPEAVRLGGGAWYVAVAVEIIHQVLSTVMRLIDPGELTSIARDAAGADAPEALADGTVTATIITAGVFSTAVMVFVGWATSALTRNNRRARTMRMLLGYFTVFFTLRAMLLFTSGQTMTADQPLWLSAVDGSLQILAAAAAVTGTVLLFRKQANEFFAAAEPKNHRDSH
ncbi:hypothetical protein ACFSSC_01105 [Corynebacterium mendelii]|uniref:Uncharacterized protein n=1 Tax=Corynebacterium mendelii TaxID=2765362 RepID=A0A939IXB1_9CORY|nr:hypothetical protein [Corynebacterium mendelii]MBN9643883.1 hypothetical protein [Corynebacterium mendelii]